MDNFGTFYKTSQWPGIWWNLNLQLTYMSTLPTNRLHIASNFKDLIDNKFVDVLNASDPQKVGDFAWALHTYYQYLQCVGMSLQDISPLFMPKAEAVYNLYTPHFKEDDGVINLENVESPEYNGFKTYQNSNYNLGTLRWLLVTMTKICEMTDYSSPRYSEWKHVLEKLHPYVMDENGFRIASDQAVDQSHRHYSHLLSFYPLRLQDITDSKVNAILEKSIDHWLNYDGGKQLAGYSYTGAASLYAYQGNGEKAYAQLHHFLTGPLGLHSFLLPNTMYVESDGKNPVIETPLSAATAITEMLLQSWGDVIRLFPAVPDEWKECSFQKLRAEGGFEVSAVRRSGHLAWVKIHSVAGRPCRIYVPDTTVKFRIKGKGVSAKTEGDNYVSITIPKGSTAELLWDKIEDKFDYEIPVSAERWNYYGVKTGKSLPSMMDWPIMDDNN